MTKLDDNTRLRHMLDAAKQVQTFMQGRNREDLDSDPMLLFAVVKAIEIIGEAAARGVYLSFAAPHPKSLSQRGRGTLNPAPLLPLWEKGLGDEGHEFAKVGCTPARVSPERQTTIPQLPWPQMVGMRNRLTHAYFDIDTEVVWKTIVEDLPELIPLLESALPD